MKSLGQALVQRDWPMAISLFSSQATGLDFGNVERQRKEEEKRRAVVHFGTLALLLMLAATGRGVHLARGRQAKELATSWDFRSAGTRVWQRQSLRPLLMECKFRSSDDYY